MSEHKWKAGDRFSLLQKYGYSSPEGEDFLLPIGQTGTIVSVDNERAFSEIRTKLDPGHKWPWDEVWFPARVLQLLPPHVWKDGDRFTIPYQDWMGKPHEVNYKLKDATGVFRGVRDGDKYAKITLDPGFWPIPNPSIPLDNLQYLPKEKYSMNDLQSNVWSYLLEPDHAERKLALKELSVGGFFTDEAADSAEDILKGWVDGWEREETFCGAGLERFRDQFFGPKFTGEVNVWFELGFRLSKEQAEQFRSDYGNKAVEGIDVAERVKQLIRSEFDLPAYHNCYYGETGLYGGEVVHVSEVEEDSYFENSPPRA